MSNRGQITIGENGLLYALYTYWQNHGSPKPGNYRENLCHFCRVVFLWVPLLWFFAVPIDEKAPRLRWLRPWMIAASTLGVGAYGFALGRWFETAFPLTLMVFLGCIILIAGAAGAIGAMLYLFNHEDAVRRVWRVMTLPLCLVGRGIVWAAEKIDPYAEWFFTERYLRYVQPWMPTTVVAWVIVALINVKGALELLGWAVLIVVVCCVGIALTLGIIWSLDRDGLNIPGRIKAMRAKGTYKRQLAFEVHHVESASIFRVLWAQVVATKHKVCPFIVLPSVDEQEEQAS